jgi:hypothetical protein
MMMHGISNPKFEKNNNNNEHALQFIKEKVEKNLSHASKRPFVGIRPHVHLFLISPLYAGK